MNRIAAFLLGFLATAAAAQERPAAFLRLPAPAGVAALVAPDAGADAPLVIVLPDALGADLRAELYIDSLLARGIATLRVGLGFDNETATPLFEPAASPEAVAPALEWARRAGFAEGRIAIMGFGLGGRAALAGARGLPAVALYPGCEGLTVPESGPALVLQGGDDAAGCADLPARPGLALQVLPGVGHAWDAPGAIWPSPGPLLPDPAGGEARRRARTDAEATRDAAERVADWAEQLLDGILRSASR
jgi:dienelactone hydrolase